MIDAGNAIWLYGSHARGVTDADSDLDIFVATSDLTGSEKIENTISQAWPGASLSMYTWREITRMAEYGSLFLQHLKIEATPLHESPSCRGVLRQILGDLPNYSLAARDVDGFNVVLEDVGEALDDDGSETYELAVLGTVIRHSAILGCWLLNRPTFGRLEPVSRFACLRGFEHAVGQQFPDLYSYRLYADGRVGRERLNKVPAVKWLARARGIVASVEELTGERDR